MTHEIIIVTYSSDICLLYYNLLSLRKNWHGDKNLTIVIEDNKIGTKRWCQIESAKILQGWNINILMPPKIAARDGWHRQQVLKLWAASISKYEYVVILDCKNILVNSYSFNENFEDKVQLINLYREEHVNEYDKGVWKLACSIFEKNYDEISKCFSVTPFIWKTDILKSMIKFLKKERQLDIYKYDAFDWYESSLYWAYAQDKIKYKRSERDLVVGQNGGIGEEFTLSNSNFKLELYRNENEHVPIFNFHRFHIIKENFNTLNEYLISKDIITSNDVSIFQMLFEKHFFNLRHEVKEYLNKDKSDTLVSDTVAALKGIPTKEELKALLAQNVLVVSFTKLDGDRRDMTCTLREDMKPAATKADPLSQKKIREISDAVVSVWDVNAKGWRSFRYDRIISVDYIEEYEQSWYNNS